MRPHTQDDTTQEATSAPVGQWQSRRTRRSRRRRRRSARVRRVSAPVNMQGDFDT